jgi:hypothetical protein
MVLEKRADCFTTGVVWLYTWAKTSVSSKLRVEVSGNTWVLKRPCWMLLRSSRHTGKSAVAIVSFAGDVDSFLVFTSPLHRYHLTAITEVFSCGICGDSAMSMSRPYNKTARSYLRLDITREQHMRISESVKTTIIMPQTK